MKLAALATVLLLAAGALSAAPAAPAEGRDIDRALWRAEARLGRGDIFLAHPLFAELYGELRTEGSARSARAALGLATCEIARGASASAVAPWLDVLNAHSDGASQGDAAEGAAIALLDASAGLVPLLPPIWLPGPELAPLVDEGFAEQFLAGEAVYPEVRALAYWYRRAALFEVGAEMHDAAPPPAPSEWQPAVTLVADIVLARTGDATERAAARERLRAALDAEILESSGSWREAWLRAGIGRSLLREPDAALRLQGASELLHLPARFRESQPRLAAIALAHAARTLRGDGDAETAARLAAMLTGPLADPGAIRWTQNTQDQPPSSPKESPIQ